MSDYDYLFKVIVVGDGAVGKTALTIRFSEGRFQDHYKMTIGVDFAIKMVEIEGRRVKLQIWDTGGQERFSYIRPLYYKGAMGVCFIFDITNRSSFEHLPKWFKEVSDYCGAIPALLVANKCDLPDKAITRDEATQMAAQINAFFFEASAKTGDNVDDLFSMLGKMLIHKEGLVAPAPTSAPTPAPASAPASAPTPAPASAPAPATFPASSPTPPPQTTDSSLDEALSFLNANEETTIPTPAPPPSNIQFSRPSSTPALFTVPEPKPVSIPEPKPVSIPKPKPVSIPKPKPVSIPKPKPVSIPKPKPVSIPEPKPVSIPEPKPVSIPEPKPVSIPEPKPVSIPEPTSTTSTLDSIPKSPAPFSSFLTASKPQETQSSFIPFVPQISKPESKPVVEPVTPLQEPVTLRIVPQPAPTTQNICPNCRKIVSPRWRFCTFCGKPL
ncbi:MAG: GTP-binding protein [Promethearchaeota archaeon]